MWIYGSEHKIVSWFDVDNVEGAWAAARSRSTKVKMVEHQASDFVLVYHDVFRPVSEITRNRATNFSWPGCVFLTIYSVVFSVVAIIVESWQVKRGRDLPGILALNCHRTPQSMYTTVLLCLNQKKLSQIISPIWSWVYSLTRHEKLSVRKLWKPVFTGFSDLGMLLRRVVSKFWKCMMVDTFSGFIAQLSHFTAVF